jgi:sulfoxide reductase catalytic subunit YedY
MGFRAEHDSKNYTAIDEDRAGRVPAQYGVAPRVRIGHNKWFNLLWLIPIGLLLLIIGIAVAKGIRGFPAV